MSSDTVTATPAAASTAPPTMAPAEAALWHGYLLADAGLPAPACLTDPDALSRPAYTDVKNGEYADSPAVLDVKADLLIKMWTAATHPLVYAGAGISTSSGIRDYASNAKASKVQPAKRALTMEFINALKPTPAHRVIAAMERAGLVWGWLQQNHDGLAQKAGFPAHKVNELHGSWLDKVSNPIIKMDGSLRGDLFGWLEAMEEGADFVFAVGSSLSGLNADRLVETAARRHMGRKTKKGGEKQAGGGKGQGACILSIQKTQRDHLAALRVFSRIDDFMLIVARKLRLRGIDDTRVYPYAAPKLPVGPPAEAVWLAERAAKRAAYAEEVAAAEAKEAATAAAVAAAAVMVAAKTGVPAAKTTAAATAALAPPPSKPTAAGAAVPLKKATGKSRTPPRRASVGVTAALAAVTINAAAKKPRAPSKPRA